MPIIDKGETLKSWRNSEFSYTLNNTLTAQDYLGDTTNSTGLSMPNCDVEQVHYNAGTASGSGTTITLHNVTAGTSVGFTPDASAEAVDVTDLHFDAGDELAVEVSSVDGTTAGGDVSLVLDYEQNLISST